MINEFLSPVEPELQEFASQLDAFTIGANLNFETELSENSLVVFSVRETRRGLKEFNDSLDFSGIRKQFYQLKKGNWHLPIFDLGELKPGATVEDTYFAFQKIQQEILAQKCILIILGGTSDLIYHQYRAFDDIKLNLNLSLVDNRFRLGNDSEQLNYQNYLSKIIAKPPHNLFEYYHMGFQTYFVAQEELDLMEHLNFDVKRLGKLTDNIAEAEPELRNSDMVAINLESIQSADMKSVVQKSPNGFSAREICALSRYAGINNKVQSFGVYNFKVETKETETDELLIAQILWYFVEGKNHAPSDLNLEDEAQYEKFYVQIPEQDIVFYHHVLTDQWWLALKEMNDSVEEGIQITPCSHKDYLLSLEGKIPDRWWKSYKKLY